MPGAYFMANYEFRSRKVFLALSAVPFCLPPILVVLAFVLYYGNAGWFTKALRYLGLAGEDAGSFLYSIRGMVFIHAFYNFPIVMQSVGSAWSRLPKSREEAARSLGAGKFRAFAVGTLPHLFPTMVQAASLVFLFCVFSFIIALVFGGLAGSTLQVDIYRASRFMNNNIKALSLTIVQAMVALIVVGVFSYFGRMKAGQSAVFGKPRERARPKGSARACLILYQAMLLVFFIGPLASLAVEAFMVPSSMGGTYSLGFGNFRKLLFGFNATLPRAIITSLATAGIAAAFATVIGVAVAAAQHYTPAIPAGNWICLIPMAISPIIISIGWSMAISSSDILLVILGQTMMAWSFVTRSSQAAFAGLERNRHEAARTLGASPIQAFIRVDAAAMAPSIASAAAFAFSITMGDASIPLAMGGGKVETLPLLLYRLTTSYRFNEACAAGIVLALFTAIAFFLKERIDVVS